MGFKVGDKVRWQSQANGCYREKQGEVVAAVATGQRPLDLLARLRATYQATDEWGHGFRARKHESYIVLVRYPGTKRHPKLYVPVVSQLELVEKPAYEIIPSPASLQLNIGVTVKPVFAVRAADSTEYYVDVSDEISLLVRRPGCAVVTSAYWPPEVFALFAAAVDAAEGP